MKEKSAIFWLVGALVVVALVLELLLGGEPEARGEGSRAGEAAQEEERPDAPAAQPLERVDPEAEPPAAPPVEAQRAQVDGAAPPAEEVDPAAGDGSGRTLARVSGRCVDQAGGPVAGAEVRCGSRGESVESEGDGSFVLEVDLGGRLRASQRLHVARAGFGGAQREVLLRAGDTADVGELVLRAVGFLSGHVVDEAGVPRAGASLAVEEALGPSQGSRFEGPDHPLVRGETGPDGEFLLEVPAGAVRLWAGGEGLSWAATATLAVPAGDEIADLELVVEPLEDADTIELVVLDPSGAPVPFADVHYAYRSGNTSGSGNTNTDAEGRLVKFVPTRAPHTFTAFDAQGRWRPAVARDVPPGARGVELRLAEPTQFTVRARDAGGQPVERFHVTLRGTEAGLQQVGASEGDGPHEGGSVALLVPVVPFEVLVEAEGFALAVQGPFEPDAVPDPLEVELEALPGVRGRVTGAGEPLAGALVSLHEAIGSGESLVVNGFPCRSEPHREASTRTDAEGRFSLTLRRAGRWYLRAEAPGFAPSDVGPLELDPAAGAEELALDLGRGGTLQGRVLVEPGDDPSGWIVGVSRGDGFGYTERTDPHGGFSFEGLAAGPWLVRWCQEEISTSSTTSSRSSGGGGEGGELPWSCEVEEGGTTTFDLDLRDLRSVELAVRFALGEASLAGWRASLDPADSDARDDQADLEPGGRARLRTNLPGAFHLRLEGPLEGGIQVSLGALLQLEPGSNAWERALPAGRIEGHALLDSLAPDSVLEITWEDGATGLHASVAPRPDGTFAVPAFPAGLATVRYHLAIGELGETRLEVRAGETAVISVP